ncbi:MAG: FtsQ-type POTRA domain-containing protein [Leptolyngbyaceae cyanobacterium bins.59]|nr:FtsQ-type POTRA domain-containing protein [Leptolyngbyaceae cyanobacterium bins.59]
MTSISSVSRTELSQRRKQLRHQRRLRNLRSIWRGVALMTLAGGVGWAVVLPTWMISKPEQVEVRGNRHLSSQTIVSLLGLTYPQSLLQVQPNVLSHRLTTQPTITRATVTRQLLPPRLQVQVQERFPVAIAVAPQTPLSLTAQTNPTSSNFTKTGLMDDQGVWIPLDSYSSSGQAKMPDLRVIGMQENYQTQWATLYPILRQSPVKISEIDWQNSSNLILKTELGVFHLGPYGPNFPEQIAAIDRMRKLPRRLNPNQIAYIDLSNPEFPVVQTNTQESAKSEKKSKSR